MLRINPAWFAVVFLSLGLAFILTALPIDAFYDRGNYLVYAENSINIFYRYFNGGFLRTFSNEPIWLGINIFLSGWLSPENTLRAIIFCASFVTAYLALKNNYKYWYLVFLILLLPQVIKNDIVHLRQGLALAVFLIGWYSESRRVKFLFIGAAPFIHASFFFIDFILIATLVLQYLRYSNGIRVIIITLLGVALSFSLIFVTSMLGARQADEYFGVVTSASGLAFVFWFVILLLFISEGKRFAQDNAFQISVLVFYLSTYFFMPVTARIFESATLLVLISGLYLTKWRRWAFLSAFVFYFVFSYLPRLGQPMLGWAHSGF